MQRMPVGFMLAAAFACVTFTCAAQDYPQREAVLWAIAELQPAATAPADK